MPDLNQFFLNLSQSGYLSILLGILVPFVGAGIVFLMARARRDNSRGSKEDMATYPERVKQLSGELARASSEVEHVLEEMAIVSRSRTEAFANLEQRVKEVAQHEQDLQTRVETLKNISLPAAEYFLEAHEKPKAAPQRDYLVFGLGVLASAAITLILKLLLNL
jgi:hypothetical protein